MHKTKSPKEPTVESERSTQDEVKQDTPRKQGEPVKIARAARELSSAKSGESDPRRAQLAGSMQGAVGNTRVGQMLGAEQAGASPPATAIQRQPKGGAAPKPPPITTPLPKEAKRKPSGEAVVAHPGIQIIILPDKRSKKKLIVDGQETDAVTRPSLHWSTPKNYKTADGKITEFNPPPAPTMTIQTTYGPGAGSGDKSAYGKGTTAEDIKAGRTTLGYHEGSHGQDFLQFVEDNPSPQFRGRVGITEDEYKQSEVDYNEKMQAYAQALNEYSKKQTDCVGTKMDGCDK